MTPTQKHREAWKNTSSHPLYLDDGTVIGAGEFAYDIDTRGATVKAAIEAGHLVKSQAAEKTEKPNG